MRWDVWFLDEDKVKELFYCFVKLEIFKLELFLF